MFEVCVLLVKLNKRKKILTNLFKKAVNILCVSKHIFKQTVSHILEYDYLKDNIARKSS